MWFPSRLSSRKRRAGLRPLAPRNSASPRRSLAPWLEVLEDRTLPSVLTVLNGNDSGPGSLRDRIAAAASGDTIVFDPSLNGQTITLTSGELPITKRLDVEGPGANLLTVSGNHASRVFDVANGVTGTLAGLTIASGQSDFGGGVFNAGVLTLSNCTFAGNSTNSNSQSGGGGVFNAAQALMTLTNCTLAGNSAGTDGGGIDTTGTLAVANTIVAGNTAPSGPDILGEVTSRGHNLIGNPSGGSGFVASDLVGTAANPLDPRLGPLQDNGGPTRTMALLPGSPARGAGSVALAVDASGNPLSTDQRGFARVVDGAVDVGAFEVQHFVVTTTADAGPGSLRAAVTGADLAGGSDVTFAVSGTITLQSALPDLFRSTRILGPGANVVTVQRNAGAPAFRVFMVDGPAGGIKDVMVTLSGLTIANGQAVAGGGIDNTATLTVADCILSGNSATILGGGIENDGTLTVTNTTLSGNSASEGGGIDNGGTLTVTNSTLAGNSASGSAGGIENFGVLTLTNCTLSGNSAGPFATDNGGGIENNSGGLLTLTNCTLANNTGGFGGGIINDSGGALTLTNCTLTNNVGRSDGGGIANQGALTVTGSTFSGNSSPANNGGGIFNCRRPGLPGRPDPLGLGQQHRREVLRSELHQHRRHPRRRSRLGADQLAGAAVGRGAVRLVRRRHLPAPRGTIQPGRPRSQWRLQGQHLPEPAAGPPQLGGLRQPNCLHLRRRPCHDLR
jgi:hypothetical protein